jgi:hypothetical protein
MDHHQKERARTAMGANFDMSIDSFSILSITDSSFDAREKCNGMEPETSLVPGDDDKCTTSRGSMMTPTT